MKDKTDLDQLLQQALSPNKTPSHSLNQGILQKAKEMKEMKQKFYQRIPAAALIAVAILSVGSLTVAASLKYLTPDKAAEAIEDVGLAEAFQSKDAIFINESQTSGDYKVTLLGIVSGERLSRYVSSDTAKELDGSHTYTVTAIENADGTPRPSTSDEAYGQEPLFVSPLIQGLNPVWYNIVTMGGGYSEFVEHGVQYRITESDNVEIFADRGLYLAVSDGTFYNSEAYHFDETSGAITPNESYEGLNVLFHLPLDTSNADPDAAAQYIQKIEEELFGEEGTDTDSTDADSADLDSAGSADLDSTGSTDNTKTPEDDEGTLRLLPGKDPGEVEIHTEDAGQGVTWSE